jgi:TrmH family RNA methyltransferase
MSVSKSNLFSNIRIVLMHTSHPGNIGAAARAMKTMGLRDLCLVNPKQFPDEQASAMAAHADDILKDASVVGSLQQAIADCHVVIGTSARHQRSLAQDVFDARRCGELVAGKLVQSQKVALLFGRERTGLTNDELAHCQHLVHIPTNPDYSSLNVASAVQLLAYECRVALSVRDSDLKQAVDAMDELVTARDLQGYYQQLESMMVESGFLDPKEPRLLMQRLQNLYGRVGLTRSELNILRGMLVSFEKTIKNYKKN